MSVRACQNKAGFCFWQHIRAHGSFAARLAGVMLLGLMWHFQALAQVVEARVASVKGSAVRLQQQRSYTLAKGDTLIPGDEIDTRRGGRVVIELSDGSMVTVQPGSRVLFRDYRAATSWRDLLQILSGRIRVKIHHYGGRPNPYRVNSPTASILVRGTEFGVAVEPSGETRVVVYEGLVEVESLSDPNRRALVSPGRGVLVRFNEDLRFFTPGPGNEIGERSSSGNFTNPRYSNPTTNQSGPGGDIRKFVASDYERYINSLVEPGESPPFMRFNAFPDSHFDSLENPAYATEFNSFEGRLLFIPSFSPRGRHSTDGLVASSVFGASPLEPSDSGLLSQTTVFAPWRRGRAVFGASAAVSASRLQALSTTSVTGPATPFFPAGVPGVRSSASDTNIDSLMTSMTAARRLGEEGRTSLGLGLDYVRGRGTLRGSTELSNSAGVRAEERLDALSHVHRVRLRLGMTHTFHGGHKLGVFFRQGIASAWDRDQARTFNGLALTLDSVRYEGQSSEIGMRLRGPLTRQLFYGVESTWLQVRLHEHIRRSAIVEATERERIGRAAVSFGLGYMPNRRTVLSTDVAVGVSRVAEKHYEDATGNLIIDESIASRFFSAHFGIQTDVWRKLFASASLYGIHQARRTDLQLFPDRFGRQQTEFGFFIPNGRVRNNRLENFADFGLGWRFTPNLLGTYVLSLDQQPGQGLTTPRHVFLLRYTFRPPEK